MASLALSLTAFARLRPWWQGLRPWRRWTVIAIVAVVVLAVAARIAAPFIIREVINRRLARPGAYQGRVDDVTVSLWHGRYALHDLRVTVQRPDSDTREPFIDVQEIRIGLRWRPLLRGEFVGSVELLRPELHLVPEPGERTPTLPPPKKPVDDEGRTIERKQRPAERWQDKITQVASVHIDEIRVSDGVVEYVDLKRDFTVRLGELNGAVVGLHLGSGAKDSDATLHVSGTTIGSGRLVVEAKVEPLATLPTFTARASLEEVKLKELNPATKHFDHLTFDGGTFSGYLELKAERGRIDGFFKPIFHKLDVATYRDKKGSGAARLFWKAVVPVAEFLLENDSEDQHAARIPIDGRIDKPKTDPWEVLVSSLRNAFIKALVPGFGKD